MAEDQISLDEVELEVERWLERFPRVDRDTIVARIHSLQDQLDRWEQALVIHDTLNRRNGEPEPPPAAKDAPASTPKPNKPKGMLMVMAEGEETRAWKLSDIRKIMVSRGWVRPGSAGQHQLQNVAGKLKDRKHIEPVPDEGPGFYRLTPAGRRRAAEK
jgi:hypothetical protein